MPQRPCPSANPPNYPRANPPVKLTPERPTVLPIPMSFG
jgi:hypothetical protein